MISLSTFYIPESTSRSFWHLMQRVLFGEGISLWTAVSGERDQQASFTSSVVLTQMMSPCSGAAKASGTWGHNTFNTPIQHCCAPARPQKAFWRPPIATSGIRWGHKQLFLKIPPACLTPPPCMVPGAMPPVPP